MHRLAGTDAEQLGNLFRGEQRAEMTTPDGASDGEEGGLAAQRPGIADLRVVLDY